MGGGTRSLAWGVETIRGAGVAAAFRQGSSWPGLEGGGLGDLARNVWTLAPAFWELRDGLALPSQAASAGGLSLLLASLSSFQFPRRSQRS